MAQSYEHLWALLHWLTGGLSRVADAVGRARSGPCPQKLTFHPLKAEGQVCCGEGVRASVPITVSSQLPPVGSETPNPPGGGGHLLYRPTELKTRPPWSTRTLALCPALRYISGGLTPTTQPGEPQKDALSPDFQEPSASRKCSRPLELPQPQANGFKTLKVHDLYS